MTRSQISKWLLDHDQPFTEEDKNTLALLSKTYPYFVPAKYIEASNYNSEHPFAPAILNKMRLYMGDWVSFHQFLQESQKKSTESNRHTTEVNADLEEFKDDEQEYFFDTYEEEQEGIKAEEQPIMENSHDEEDDDDDDFDFDLFNEKENKEEPYAAFDARKEKPKIPEQQGITNHTSPEQKPEVTHEPEPQPIKEEVVAETEETAMEEMQITAEDEQPPIIKHKEEPLIQPIYSEDYFLHQGVEDEEAVKEDEEDEKQLMVMMSFSDWLMHFKTKTEKQKEEEEDQRALKTMWQKEKLAAALEEENDEIPEEVFEMAVNSIKAEEDLASETIAEILIRQGKYDKAIDMYRKLSLRNPQKTLTLQAKLKNSLKKNKK